MTISRITGGSRRTPAASPSAASAPAGNPRRHRWLYASVPTGLWLLAETEQSLIRPTRDHEHAVFQVLAVLEEQMGLHSRMGGFNLMPGEMVVIPPGEIHRVTPSATGGCRSVLLDLRLDVLPRSAEAHMLDALPTLRAIHAGVEHLTQVRQQLHEAVDRPEPGRLAAVMSGVWRLLEVATSPTEATVKAGAVEAVGDARLALAESVMRERLGEPLDVPRLAASVGLSASHLTRIYREQMNTTPARRLERLRVERGYELLATGVLSVKEIAASCGFAGPAQFSRAFQRVIGCTPSQARRAAAGGETG